MARINMIKSAVSRRTSAHAPMDNVTTPYNPIRLLKGAPPGQVCVLFNISPIDRKCINYNSNILEMILMIMLHVFKGAC